MLVSVNLEETVRFVKFAQLAEYGDQRYGVMDVKSPVCLVCLHDKKGVFTEYRVFCEGELFRRCEDVRGAIFWFVTVWYLLHINEDKLGECAEDKNFYLNKATKRQEKPGSRPSVRELKGSLSNTMFFWSTVFIDAEPSFPKGITPPMKKKMVLMKRKFESELKRRAAMATSLFKHGEEVAEPESDRE